MTGALRHEVGHAFDMAALGTTEFLSSTPEFIAAYDRDWGDLDSSRRDSLAYYAQSKTAGRQEAFAEAFAASLGGGSEYIKHKTFTDAFPAVMSFVESAIRDYEPSTKRMRVFPPPLLDQEDDATAAQPLIGDPPTAISLEHTNPLSATDNPDRTPKRAGAQGQSQSKAAERAAVEEKTNTIM